MSPQDNDIRLAEAKETLENSLQYLIADAKEYDKGNFIAIKRSVITLRTLFYDSNNNSRSLLTYLNAKNDLRMKSFVTPFQKEVINYNNIYFARFKDRRTKKKYYDTFLFFPGEDKPRTLSFDCWWNEKIITFKDSNDEKDSSLNREQLIKIESNKDGVAHFDANIRGKAPRNYFDFKRGNTGIFIKQISDPLTHLVMVGGDFDPNDTNIIGQDLNLALTRQIVHETLISLIPYFDIPLNYDPDFKHNWLNKLNSIGWKLNVSDK